MKSPFGFYAVLLMLAFSLSNAYSQATGWQDNGTYKYMQIPKFEKLQFSPDGERFYTYSKDNYIRYFESESGKQVDSFYITQKIDYFDFSSDGKTAIFDSMTYENTKPFYIFDLELKEYSWPIIGNLYKVGPGKISLFDYNYKTKQFYMNQDIFEITSSGPSDTEYFKGIFSKYYLSNKVIQTQNILSEGTLKSYKRIGDSLFMITSYEEYYAFDHGSAHSSYYKCDNKYFIYDLLKDTFYLLITENKNFSSFGDADPLPDRLLYSVSSGMVLSKFQSQIKYIDPTSKTVLFTNNLSSGSPKLDITGNGLFLVQLDYGKIFIYNHSNLEIIDTIQRTDYSNNFNLNPSNDDIMSYDNTSGKLYLYKSKISRDTVNFTTKTKVVHALDTISFYNLSNIKAKKCIWYVNGLQVSENKHLDYVFDKPGSYDIELEIIDANDISHILIKEKYIRIIKKLKASFTSDFTSGKFPLDIKFLSTSLGIISGYKWFFGDGTTSIEENPKHTYNTTGQYNIRLIINDEISADTITAKDYITIASFKPETITKYNIADSNKINHNYQNDIMEYQYNKLTYLYCYSNYKSNVFFNYNIISTWRLMIEPFSWSDTRTINYLYYDLNKNSSIEIGYLGDKYFNDSRFVVYSSNTVDEYDNRLLFGNLKSFNLSDTLSYKKFIDNPCTPKYCLGHSFDSITHAFLFDSLLYITKGTNFYESFVLKSHLPDKFQLCNIIHNNGDGYLVYYTVKGQDGYYLTLINGLAPFSIKVFDINNFSLANLFKYKNKDEIVLCGSKKIYDKNSGYIVFLDKKGNIIKDFIFNNCKEIIRMHELPDGNLLFSGSGDSAYCYVIDPKSKLVVRGYALGYNSQKLVYTDIVPANDSTLLFTASYPDYQNFCVFRVNLDHKIFKAPLDVQDRSVQSEIELYPNPSNNKITLNLADIAEGAKIEVYNAMGVIVGEYVYQGDSGAYSIDISGLPIGIYFTKVICGSAVINGKFVKVE
jgi:PKD repeat protein